MTGKELMMAIIENDMEDEDIFGDKGLFGFLHVKLLPVEQVALRYRVGVETVHAWCLLGRMKEIRIGGKIYILMEDKDNEQRN